MKKIIYRFNFAMVLMLVFSVVNAENNLVGSCYCLTNNLTSEVIDCSTYTYGTYNKEDFNSDGSYKYGSICENVCQSRHSGYTWYGQYGEDYINSTLKCGQTEKKCTRTKTTFWYDKGASCNEGQENCDCSGSTTNNKCVAFDSTTSADCKYKTTNTGTNASSCTYNYSKESCSSIINGSWNSTTGCCDLTSICWLVNESSLKSELATYYYQETNPCDTIHKTNPNAICEAKKDISASYCRTGENVSNAEAEKTEEKARNGELGDFSMLEVGFGPSGQTCEEVLGDNLAKILKFIIIALRIAAAIIALVVGMLTLIPPIVRGEASELKKSTHKLVLLAIVLALVALLPTLLNIIGKIFEWDLTCII